MQTVKMVMMGLEDATVERRCAVAGELLDALSTVPTAYIQAISAPMVSNLTRSTHTSLPESENYSLHETVC